MTEPTINWKQAPSGYKLNPDKLKGASQTLEKAQEAIRLIRKYNEPVYHYVE